ncbi:MAG: hypothetical protein A3E57_05300 [Candidatus Muproteobacteria bacterium RIFCSPHIGHO2_12_FULL_60_33]|uniref:Uncharacterized protein n=1 Tax=Candidatus Muproteobacteria bacterium RIFCSPLOWO2_01_FULL_60_18 TaxID=1817768 RepID=A0A1F6TZG3_9PROT|nr:MAG: hypothetical protein A2W42_05325 [Candidatus Muproteobacteria bacterium RIFCSPHIGHO2_01_60_12]OGI50497.1 MAG: hypothetical protein A3A87_05810 [Candidatus Muproteobacteria bacterium RIFCSPLOWO2_01_FULL_60_18]OGI53480.1 MAG: hypothetical protein A3E57_05300 [Candidatus Muproteobacteria bacterium RIFCSPHIGHO2_12_FULL_60_33]OGI53971.1 MAG: hypothetical protein A3D32_03475 [Candidatus Muproteobacteria bacterium RIFCSPHIGHO2_02_FULL_60_13]OGI60127.1 MAG: hypothetical protein A2809_04975 [Can
MVEDERRRQSLRAENRHTRRVVLRPGFALGFGNINHRGGVAARVAPRIGITSQQHLERHAQRRFLLGLAHGGVLHRFADIHETARQCPAMRRILAPDQHNRDIRTVPEFDDDIRGQRGCFRCRHDLFSSLVAFVGCSA